MIVDSAGKPWLLEVNSSPALEIDGKVDDLVKTRLVNDTLDLLDLISPEDYWINREKNAKNTHKRRISDMKIANFPSIRVSNPENYLRNSLQTHTIDHFPARTRLHSPAKRKETSVNHRKTGSECPIPANFSENRPANCGLYELICPLSAVIGI